MNEKSVPQTHFYRLLATPEEASEEDSDAGSDTGAETFQPLPNTSGPWSAEAQHGGPPAALLTRALERLPDAADRVLGRVTVDLLGPVPLSPLRTTARVLRPGRSVALVEAELHDVDAGRTVARATGWLFPRGSGLPATEAETVDHSPDDGLPLTRPAGWLGGYLDAIEWRWIRGNLERPGSGVVWMRTPHLVEGEDVSPVQRVLACVDSASGVGSALDVAQWAFLNTELTVHLLRPPVGEWLCVDASTTLVGSSTGLATAAVYDLRGLVARSSQALLVTARS